MISTRPKKCRYTIPPHTVPLRALAIADPSKASNTAVTFYRLDARLVVQWTVSKQWRYKLRNGMSVTYMGKQLWWRHTEHLGVSSWRCRDLCPVGKLQWNSLYLQTSTTHYVVVSNNINNNRSVDRRTRSYRGSLPVPSIIKFPQISILKLETPCQRVFTQQHSSWRSNSRPLYH